MMPDYCIKSRDFFKSSLAGANHHENSRHVQMEIGEARTGDIEPAPKSRNNGRPGMEPWRIPVMGVLKQGPGCGCDWLHGPAAGTGRCAGFRVIRASPGMTGTPSGR